MSLRTIQQKGQGNDYWKRIERCKLINSKTHKLKNSSTQKRTNSTTHQFSNSTTQELNNSRTQQLKLLFFLQSPSFFRPILAKIQVKKQANSHHSQHFTSFNLSVFKNRTCILHHLAFLFGRPLAIFSLPNTRIQVLKPHFLMAILPFSGMCFMVRKGFVYTISADIYAFRLAFSGKKYCIQHHFTLRLAPKRIAFSTKTHCIQQQNALRLAAYCTAFSTKMHCVQHQIAPKWVQMAVFPNKNSFCRIHILPPFCIKTNLRENRFFEAWWAIGGQKGHL